jgi:flagellar biosynthesis/type III secretory pathway ATPase
MIDRAIQLMGQINGFLRQTPDELTELSRGLDRLEGILNAGNAAPVTSPLGNLR